jgi:hypothetical protein
MRPPQAGRSPRAQYLAHLKAVVRSVRIVGQFALSKVRGRLHIARLACDGLGGDDGGGSLIASMIFEIEEELKEISRKFHPPACEEDIDHIRRQVEFSIAGLLKEREKVEREEAQERVVAHHFLGEAAGVEPVLLVTRPWRPLR